MSSDANETELHTLLLGRYRVEGSLGEGGLGTVVKAFDTRLKRLVLRHGGFDTSHILR